VHIFGTKLKMKKMKKSVFMLLAIIATIAFSCSKDAKINRRIDGEWKVVSVGGVPLPIDESVTFKFIKDDKLTGDGTLTETWDSGSYTTPFTYTVGSEKIIFVMDGSSEVLTVLTYEKDKLELIDSDSDVWVLDPK
jgi:hypothetical protein